MDTHKLATIESVINILKKRTNVVSTEAIDLRSFELFKNLEYKSIRSWKISHRSDYFTFNLIGFLYEYSKFNNYTYFSNLKEEEFKLIGYVDSQIDLGKTLMRPETFLDKLSEIFQAVEIDIDSHKKFSQKYYVISNDKPLLLKNLSLEIMDLIAGMEKLTIEFDHNKCIFFTNKKPDQNNIMEITNFGLKLHFLLNKTEL